MRRPVGAEDLFLILFQETGELLDKRLLFGWS
jgi:hypothetical protein